MTTTEHASRIPDLSTDSDRLLQLVEHEIHVMSDYLYGPDSEGSGVPSNQAYRHYKLMELAWTLRRFLDYWGPAPSQNPADIAF